MFSLIYFIVTSTTIQYQNSSTTRIIGGNAIDIENVPFIVRIYRQYSNSGHCGAALISPTNIITAAHCVTNSETYTVGVYTNTRLKSDSNNYCEELIDTSSVHIHPQNTHFMIHDIAILTLSRTPRCLLTRNTISGPMPIILDNGNYWPASTSIPHVTSGTVAGWGVDNYQHGTTSATLHAADIYLYSRTQCNNWYRPLMNGDDLSMTNGCAGIYEGGLDACTGDSGGPLYILERNVPILVGIVSWGYGCALPGYPGVYTLISAEKDFIQSIEPDATFQDPLTTNQPCPCNICANDRCGCDVHIQGVQPFCYVSQSCNSGIHSMFNSSLKWQFCDPSHSPPTPLQTSPPPTPLPLPPSPPPSPPPPSPTPSPTPPSPPDCRQWCYTISSPSKCRWNSCKNCDICTPSPMSPPSTPPSPLDCKNWCSNYGINKCSWTNCGGCSECSSQTQCKSWCRLNMKCNWKSCQACEQCNRQNECRPWCTANNCGWKYCAACSVCS